jgi:hypothetical protein
MTITGVAHADAVPQHRGRAFGEHHFLADARRRDFGDDLAGRFGGARGVAHLRQFLVALDQHQVAEFFGNILPARLGQRRREFHPEIGRDGAIDFGRRLRAQADDAEVALGQILLAKHFGDAGAAGRHAIIVDPQCRAALLRPARPHHPQIGPGDDDRIALEREDHAAFIVIVADIGLVHLT